MDEVRGREVAARMGIKIMGTIGVLGTAFEEIPGFSLICNS